MERLQALGGVLPYLRRYAHTLTRSPDRGDRYVRQFIEVVLMEPALIDDDPLMQTFSVFHEVCRGLPPMRGRRARGRRGARESASRQLRLLTSLGGLAPEAAAAIVGGSRGQRRLRPERRRA